MFLSKATYKTCDTQQNYPFKIEMYNFIQSINNNNNHSKYQNYYYIYKVCLKKITN